MTKIAIAVTWNILAPVAGTSVKSLLSWNQADPLVLTLQFQDNEGKNGTIWNFARDLVVDAFTDGTAGTGDVRITIDEDRLGLNLTSGSTMFMDTAAEPVRALVQRTHRVVTPGNEDLSAGIDAAIQNILGCL